MCLDMIGNLMMQYLVAPTILGFNLNLPIWGRLPGNSSFRLWQRNSLRRTLTLIQTEISRELQIAQWREFRVAEPLAYGGRVSKHPLCGLQRRVAPVGSQDPLTFPRFGGQRLRCQRRSLMWLTSSLGGTVIVVGAVVERCVFWGVRSCPSPTRWTALSY